MSVAGSGLDTALPAAADLLDPARAAEVLAAAAEGASLGPVAVRYLRWKPGTNLVVRYDVEVDGLATTASAYIRTGGGLGGWAADLGHQRLAAAAAAHAAVPSPLAHVAATDVLVQWFPLDLRLPALAQGAVTVAQRAGVGPAGRTDVELLAYKPRRRAVQRVGEVVVKVHAAAANAQRAALAARLAARALGRQAPEPVGACTEDRSTAQAWVSGRPIERLGLVDEVRELLVRLHAASPRGLHEAGVGSQLVQAPQTATLVVTAVPRLADTVERLLSRLGAEAPPDQRHVLCHGDLSADQLIISPQHGLVLLDHDEAVAGPPALDWASFATASVQSVADLEPARATLAVLAPMLNPAQGRWWMATALLRRAAFPLRSASPGWPDLLAARVAAAAAALQP
ncbi:MAG: aminoglycoside phosphotransferase family protein [Acidimicrobiales bacterium]